VKTVEVKRRLDGSEERFECEPALLEPGGRAILVYVLERAWTVHGLALERGVRTYAHYWIDRLYNVYHWIDGAGTLGHYFNVGRCKEIAPERVTWTDYALDVLRTPDGRVRLLDEDELSRHPDARLRATAERTAREIIDRIDALVAEVETATRSVLG